MTNPQAELLKKCIHAVRFAQDAKEKNDSDSYRWRDFELVEVGPITGVSKKTAQALVDVGVLVSDLPSYAGDFTGMHVRLPREDEIGQ